MSSLMFCRSCSCPKLELELELELELVLLEDVLLEDDA